MSTKYYQRLENYDIKEKDFVLIQKDSEIYYGQVNQENMRHGIGTLLFENDFIYQGMFDNDHQTGIGMSRDPNGTVYLGEHREGKREGKGILYFSDGRVYQGTWMNNRMHGKGQEKLPNGQSYMVFTDNGKRLEYVTIGKDQEGNNQNLHGQGMGYGAGYGGG